MIKKYFFAMALLLIVSMIANSQTVNNADSAYRYTRFPDFSVVTCDSVWVSNKNIPANNALVFIYFSPDCTHCQYEAKQIYKNINSFKNITFLWVSYHKLSEIKEFKTQYHLDSLPNVIFARDPKYFLPAYFKVAFTPYIAVYNSKKIFVKEFRGGAEAEELIKSLH